MAQFSDAQVAAYIRDNNLSGSQAQAAAAVFGIDSSQLGRAQSLLSGSSPSVQQASDTYASQVAGRPDLEAQNRAFYDPGTGQGMGVPLALERSTRAQSELQDQYSGLQGQYSGLQSQYGSLQEQLAMIQQKYDELAKRKAGRGAGGGGGTTGGGQVVDDGASFNAGAGMGTGGVVYGPDGTMYSSPAAAIAAGVTNFTYTKPVVPKDNAGLINKADTLQGVPPAAAGNANPGALIAGQNQQLFNIGVPRVAMPGGVRNPFKV